MSPRTGPTSTAIGADLDRSRPCLFVLFGATGDLAARKIAPALYNLTRDGLVDSDLSVLGVARRAKTDDEFRNEMRDAIGKHSRSGAIDEALWAKMARRWHYAVVHADAEDEFNALATRLDELDRQHGCEGNRVFYLAMPPDSMAVIAENLARAGLAKPSRERSVVRLIIEKPFGRDLESARALNDLLLRSYDEDQLYRIDHYLGKETVQNLLVFRFANAIFEPMLNRQYVDHVQITTAETVGMEGRRGSYYDTAGALRDMLQNHMMQLLSLIAMEVPSRLTAERIRDEKVKLLRAIRPLTPGEVCDCTVRAQYGAGEQGPAYREESGVGADSRTETFAAVKLFIDNWRWSSVPFYLRTGKRLGTKTSQIVVVFRREPLDLFQTGDCDWRGPNRLIIRIAPHEGICVAFDAKVPGARALLRPVKMDFNYDTSFHSASPEAYEHLLLDAIRGDATQFIRNDEVEQAWRFVDSIRSTWDTMSRPEVLTYAPGSWGPEQADALFDDPYQRWLNPQ